MKKTYFVLVTLLLIIFQVAQAEASKSSGKSFDVNNPLLKVTGIVTSITTNEALPGVNIVVKGTAKGTITDFDGKYSIDADAGSILVFSFVGYRTLEVPVNGRSEVNIGLEEATENLEDVVVTALGIKRDKKALGYAVQDVKGDDLSKTNSSNVVSTLAGRVAGVQIITASGQVGASSSIQIRGNKSFTGSNQPLFIVDGIPIQNSTSSARDFLATDFGNAAMDIDPANIENISILKGASASALYGSRAANGVILITTKRKKDGQKGVGVELTSSISVDNVYNLPNYQNSYGQGFNGSEYEYEKRKATNPSLTYQDYADKYCFRFNINGIKVNPDADESWGARLDAGLLVDQIHGEKQPWISHPNNVKDFFETGITTNNNLVLATGNENITARLTLGNSNQKGTSPNTDQKKTNVSFSSNFNLSPKISGEVNINYIDLRNDNLPQTENSMQNPLIEFNSWFGRQVDTKYLKDHYEDIILYNGKPTALNWMMDYNDQHNNPYWSAYKNTMERQRKRTFGNISATYKINDNFEITGKVGSDFYIENRKYLYHQYSRSWSSAFKLAVNGSFYQQYSYNSETNADLLLKYKKNIGETINFFATLGSNYRYSLNQYASVQANNLTIPDFFSTEVIDGDKITSFSKYEKKSNSVFGSVNVGYKSYLFLDLTGRNDWSSTLPKSNWSYWYPSVNVGFIFTEAFKIKSNYIDYGKVRLGYAIVGNDADAYQLSPVFTSVTEAFNGVKLFYKDNVLPSTNLKPEETKSLEGGLELKFLKNRLGADLTYYKATTYNQILKVEVPYSSGYNSWLKNAGEVENKGIELQLYGTPIQKNDFSWDISLNWSKNNNKVVKLEDGINQLQISSMYSLYNIYLMAFPGESWGSIYGKTLKRDESGNVLIGSNGLPITASNSSIIGQVTPDWIGGIRNTFRYKNFNLSVLLDFRHGGDIFSMTKSVGQKAGILQNTVEGGIRENGMVVEGVYAAGVKVAGEDVSGKPNQTVVSAFSYFDGSRSWGELSVVDGSFVKLREIVLDYTIKAAFLSKLKIQNASVSVFGRNLALLYKDKSNDVNIDPEVSSGGTVSGIGIESYQVPPCRTFGLKLSLKF